MDCRAWYRSPWSSSSVRRRVALSIAGERARVRVRASGCDRPGRQVRLLHARYYARLAGAVGGAASAKTTRHLDGSSGQRMVESTGRLGVVAGQARTIAPRRLNGAYGLRCTSGYAAGMPKRCRVFSEGETSSRNAHRPSRRACATAMQLLCSTRARIEDGHAFLHAARREC